MYRFARLMAVVAAALFCIAITSAAQSQDDELKRKEMKFSDLPPRVSETMGKALGYNKANGIFEVRYQEIAIMYETDYVANRRKIEIAILPRGERIPSAQLKGPKNKVIKKKITLEDLPAPVVQAIGKRFGEAPLTEIRELRYRGCVVLYEVDAEDRQVTYLTHGEPIRDQKKISEPPTEEPGEEPASKPSEEPDPEEPGLL